MNFEAGVRRVWDHYMTYRSAFVLKNIGEQGRDLLLPSLVVKSLRTDLSILLQLQECLRKLNIILYFQSYSYSGNLYAEVYETSVHFSHLNLIRYEVFTTKYSPVRKPSNCYVNMCVVIRPVMCALYRFTLFIVNMAIFAQNSWLQRECGHCFNENGAGGKSLPSTLCRQITKRGRTKRAGIIILVSLPNHRKI